MNRYIIIGWLGENPELFQFIDIAKGKQTARELIKSPAWRPTWEGSLIDLIAELEKKIPEAIIVP